MTRKAFCSAVVDGGMIITDAGRVVYADVDCPRVGAPGFAYLRMVNQSLVQDRELEIEERGSHPTGAVLANVWCDGESVNEKVAAALAEYRRWEEEARGDAR